MSSEIILGVCEMWKFILISLSLWSLCVFISLAISHSRIRLNNWCKLSPLNPEFQVSTPRLTIWRALFSPSRTLNIFSNLLANAN